jgi:hypothetical protein
MPEEETTTPTEEEVKDEEIEEAEVEEVSELTPDGD